MMLTTENAEKFFGAVLVQRLPGRHVRRIKVSRFPDGKYCYCTVDGTYMDVPTPNDKYHVVEIIKVVDCEELMKDFDFVVKEQR